MIYLKLFITFFKIGLFTFGGGYAMIPLIKSECLINNWLSEVEIANFIGISESTPGPIAINMATFIGTTKAGILGGIIATFGVVLPSFVIILIIATVLKNLEKNKYYIGAIKYVTPVIVALILSTGFLMLLKNVFGNDLFSLFSKFSFSIKSILIIFIVVLLKFVFEKTTKKKITAIPIIIFSALMGIIIL